MIKMRAFLLLAICLFSCARAPVSPAGPDLEARVRSLLSRSQYGKYESAKAELVYAPAQDGARIPIWVRIPAKCAQPCPVVVFYHGGPHNQAMPGYDERAEIFLREGFIYATPNIRGSSGYGEAWEYADRKEKRLRIISDLEDCSNFLRERFSAGEAQPKLGILGWSYGGYLALMGMTKFSGSYDAGYAIAAKTDLLSFFRNAPAKLRKEREKEYGDPDKNPELFRQLSPVTYVDQAQGPIALVLGKNDPKVSIPDGEKFIRALKRRGVPAAMIVTDGSHYTTGLESKVQEYLAIARFFMVSLK